MITGGYVYLTTTKKNTVIYTGVTIQLKNRIHKHKTHYYPNAFTRRYNATKLVYYRGFQYISEAIAEEKRIKSGSRAQKVRLINSQNPEWVDLYDSIPDGE